MNDSIWAVIAGVSKAYTLPLSYVLYGMSYANVVMYSSVLPSYDSRKNKSGKTEETRTIKADDPRNKEEVRRFFESVE